ncbi:GGDEF domain-containing protein [Paenibacillus athensensis]|uniref:GGDEF domain-containing protein n=1 Tax=Paenibacillus athensensis TaxID=1967502 RepID=A0A4Y8PQI1_9BACL|nr:diguanylate cyclase [Paenibacillus athensensis]MCD1261176.1 GGDEF domain-containing protein [Paenibacillus athensensis]
MTITIGLLTENNWLKNEKVSLLFEGVREACAKQDVNLIRFGYLNANELLKTQSQHKMIVDFVRQFPLDGLLFQGWDLTVQAENLETLREKIRLPLFSLGKVIPGIPSNFMHGGFYLRRLLLHLLRKHGFKRIAYICPWTPDGRNEVYRRTMTKMNVWDDTLYVDEHELQGYSMYERAERAVSILLDERKVRFDAIIALTMEEAFTVQRTLLERGFRVPGDVAVCCYEDGRMVQFTEPSITSIYYPIKEVGYCGAEQLIHTIRTGRSSTTHSVPGKIAYRESCGCVSDTGVADPAGEVRRLGWEIEERDFYFHRLEEAGHMLNTSHDRSVMLTVMKQAVAKLNIPTCYMFLNDTLPDGGGDWTMGFRYEEGKAEPAARLPFQEAKALCFPEDRRFCYTAELLHIGDRHFGFLLLDGSVHDVRNLLTFSGYVSNALHNTSLISRLTQLAHYDPLTHLYNRRSFHESLTRLTADNHPFSLMYMDVDGFKQVNDQLGHEAGDLLLQEMACRLARVLQPYAVHIAVEGEGGAEDESREQLGKAIFRLGGDEFMGILHSLDELEQAQVKGEMERVFREPFPAAGRLSIGISVGFSRYPHDATDSSLLISLADARMYKDKNRKKALRQQGRISN